MVLKISHVQGWENYFLPLVGGPRACFPRKCWKLVSWDWLKMHFQHFRHNQFVVKMLRSSSNRGNCCFKRKFFFDFTAYLEIVVMYCEGGQRGRLGRSDCINLKFLGWIYSFFFHFFATWESLFSQFLVKVRSCGHFLVSAKPAT